MSPIIIGLPILFFVIFMIYTLIKNALVSAQLSPRDRFNGKIDLIIPMTENSLFFQNAWLEQLSSKDWPESSFKIHLLFTDSFSKDSKDWLELKENLPFIHIHQMNERPLGKEAVPWMLSQIKDSINGDVVILGDSEVVPTLQAFYSAGNLITEQKKSYFIFPQNYRYSIIQESLTSLNTNLALLSLFGFKRLRRSFSHPLFSLAKGWMCMPSQIFHEMDWKSVNFPNWKECLMKTWDLKNKTFQIAFGEKQLSLHSPKSIENLVISMKENWNNLWSQSDRVTLGLFAMILYIWAYPMLSLFSSPFFAIMIGLLLLIYRIVSKIIFQESWPAIILHPISSLVWPATLVWWAAEALINKGLILRKKSKD